MWKKDNQTGESQSVWTYLSTMFEEVADFFLRIAQIDLTFYWRRTILIFGFSSFVSRPFLLCGNAEEYHYLTICPCALIHFQSECEPPNRENKRTNRISRAQLSIYQMLGLDTRRAWSFFFFLNPSVALPAEDVVANPLSAKITSLSSCWPNFYLSLQLKFLVQREVKKKKKYSVKLSEDLGKDH